MKNAVLSTALATGMMLALSACTINVEPVTAPAAPAEEATQESADSLTVSNGMFSITLPGEAEGLFISNTTENSILIYDKEANEADFGGFAFGVTAWREPSEYYGGMDRKVGELTTADGTLYDVVMEYPSDVQWDYNVYEDMPESYALLYNGAEDIIRTLTVDDGGSFGWGAGTKGEDLYGEILKKHVQALTEEWDANRLEEEEMSPEYYFLSQQEDGGLESVGYAYMDVNFDGIEELLIGIIEEGDWKGCVYDVYTMVDRAPAHVLSGSARDRYYALEGGMMMNEYSGGAMESGWTTFDIEPNSTNILDQVKLKYDGYEDEENPWFVSYGSDDTWEPMTEEDFTERRDGLAHYVRFDFTPLSEVQE